MILVLVLLHFCSFLLVTPSHMGNRFPEANEFIGAINISITNAVRSEAASELNADQCPKFEVSSEYPVQIETLPVGQGDATVIICPDTEPRWFSLIDMGSLHSKPGAMDLDAYVAYIVGLIGRGYHLKHIFLTHPDMDHLKFGYLKGTGIGKDKGLLFELLKNPSVLLQDVTIHLGSYDNWEDKPIKTKFFKNFMDYLNANYNHFNWNRYDPDAENDIYICPYPSQVKMKIIAADLGTKPNEMSVVMSLNYQNRKMLFMGDFEGIENYRILMGNEQYWTKLQNHDVVMVSHHGADTKGNGNPLFYGLVNAKHAIISSHILNRYNHPRMNTLKAICYGIQQPSCNAWDECNYNTNEMSQGYQDFYPSAYSSLSYSSPIRYRIGVGLVYNNYAGCYTKIHQTTRIGIEDGRMKAFRVVTYLYPYQFPVVSSVGWGH